jgi:hypothetical protein
MGTAWKDAQGNVINVAKEFGIFFFLSFLLGGFGEGVRNLILALLHLGFSSVPAQLPLTFFWGMFDVWIGFFLLSLVQFPSLEEIRVWRSVQKEYPDGLQFSSEEYEQAASALRDFTPQKTLLARTRFTSRVFDLLLLAQCIWYQDGKWRRLVSIRAIEEDREADATDDEVSS